MFTRIRHRAAVAGLLLALVMLAPAAAPPARAATMPPVPASWPYAHLEIGLTDSPDGAQALRANTSFKFRYQYLCAGVNTGHGWATWNTSGQFVDYYVQDSAKYNFTPVFIYYQLLQSNPGYQDMVDGKVDEKGADLENIRNTTTMKAYWADVRLMFQHLGKYTTQTVVDLEPDLWGYIQQASSGDKASSVVAAVASSGDADMAGLPNTAAGFAQGLLRMRDLYAPDVLLGYELSTWGTYNDPIAQDLSLAEIDTLAARSVAFQKSTGAKFDLVFTDPADRDADFDRIINGDGGASWWTSTDYDRFNRYVSDFVAGTGLRMVLWQTPVGNTKMRAMNNSWGHYQDNHVEWWLGDGASAHLQTTANAGVIAILFGGGADGTTAATDAMGDGVTNPAAINGNTTASYSADDDGGYLRHQGAAYYTAGALSLPGSPPPPANLLRYAGPDRFATAARISAKTFTDTSLVQAVYIANAYNFPDALAGAAAAGTVPGPVLLVAPSGAINTSTAAELTRLKPKKIVVLGGVGAVDAGVLTALRGYSSNVARYSGTTRFATAADVSSHTFGNASIVDAVYVANAANFPDALAGAAAAGTVHGPILLANATGPLDPATVGELTRLQPKKIVVLGGTGAVGDDVLNLLKGYSSNVTRYQGADRFATAARISSQTFGDTSIVDAVYIANAYNFPDALAGAAAAGTVHGPVLLVNASGAINASTAAELTRLKPRKIVVLGGTGAVDGVVFDNLGAYLAP